MQNKDIVKAITEGRAFKSSSFLLKIAKNKDFLVKNVAYLAPKKAFPTAALRNKAKRRLREGVTALFGGGRLKKNNSFLYVFTLHKDVLKPKNKDFLTELEQFFNKNDILRP